jgi:hypothetical protein
VLLLPTRARTVAGARRKYFQAPTILLAALSLAPAPASLPLLGFPECQMPCAVALHLGVQLEVTRGGRFHHQGNGEVHDADVFLLGVGDLVGRDSKLNVVVGLFASEEQNKVDLDVREASRV